MKPQFPYCPYCVTAKYVAPKTIFDQKHIINQLFSLRYYTSIKDHHQLLDLTVFNINRIIQATPDVIVTKDYIITDWTDRVGEWVAVMKDMAT